MKLDSSKKQSKNNFSEWTYEVEETWNKDQVQEKVEEYNRLLKYCLEIEGKVELVQDSKAKINLAAENTPDTGKVLHQEVSFIEDNKTVIFLILNILFIIFTTYFFFKHPEVDIFPQENTIKKTTISVAPDSIKSEQIPAKDSLKIK
ncbi:MAG: hypothetical protein EBR87_02680 [Cytophagia bacterium]|jgi:hypothetical protein|nr:hypothetical protein [Cytophagia bacterium]